MPYTAYSGNQSEIEWSNIPQATVGRTPACQVRSHGIEPGSCNRALPGNLVTPLAAFNSLIHSALKKEILECTVNKFNTFINSQPEHRLAQVLLGIIIIKYHFYLTL